MKKMPLRAAAPVPRCARAASVANYPGLPIESVVPCVPGGSAGISPCRGDGFGEACLQS